MEECIMCGDEAEYVAEETGEWLCEKHMRNNEIIKERRRRGWD